MGFTGESLKGLVSAGMQGDTLGCSVNPGMTSRGVGWMSQSFGGPAIAGGVSGAAPSLGVKSSPTVFQP